MGLWDICVTIQHPIRKIASYDAFLLLTWLWIVTQIVLCVVQKVNEVKKNKMRKNVQ